MKKIVLLSFSLATLFATAQNVKLENGKTFKITSTAELTGELMGSEMKNNTTSFQTIKITNEDAENYKAVSTITKMTVTGNMMGQDISFDSDKKGDLDGQLGQMFGSAINKPAEIKINKLTGKQEDVKVDDEKETGMGGIMGGAPKSASIFFVIPKDKKVGDKWSETSEKDGLKTISNFEFVSLKDNLANIFTSNTTTGNTTQDANGQSIDMTIDMKSNGNIIVDSTTGIIKQAESNIDSTTNMEVGGQSMAITNKTKITTKVE